MQLSEYLGKTLEISLKNGNSIKGKVEEVNGCKLSFGGVWFNANDFVSIKEPKYNSTTYFSDSRFDEDGKRVELCEKCGEDLYRIEGLHLDNDGIRSSYYCDECSTIFACHAHGLVKHKVLKSPYSPDPDLKRDLINCCENVLKTLKKE